MTATDTYLLLRAFCDELARCGLEHACTSPGSRSTPIVLSLAREPRIRCFSHLDERCAAFFALGAAKASGRPVAIACTSGTAAANFMPAVIEARWARVPLIVLTADRPPELRDVGAGQTIDQIKLYGDAVKWFFELDVQGAAPEQLRWIRTLACRAYWTALEGPPGPVHLNIPLREPLVLEAPLPSDEPGGGGRPDGRPWVVRPPLAAAARSAGDIAPLPERGVIVAGRDERDPGLGEVVAGFAARVGYPLLADPLSGARRGSAAIAHYDLLLRDPARLLELARPELVIRVGDLPTSKPLRAWLAASGDVRQIALDPEGAWQDPAGVVSERLAVDPAATLSALSEPSGSGRWLESWLAADAAVAATLDDALGDELSEPLVARSLGRWLGPGDTLFVASSMPIRDVETFLAAADAPPRVLSSRGANGIDGTVSSAYGAAAAGPGRVVLLIGDVALAHDIGGLMAARRTGLQLTIVLLNNDGGGIFHFLPVSGEADAFEEHVATPHGLRFELAAELYGCAYARPADLPALHSALEARDSGTTIIEVRTDRERNLQLHRRLAAASLAALDELQAAAR
ncbi:MAG TPA: 2-succinyl-5-enolpyruvyl-6-hydroxy-3-cyclohexene-1-carboxylic-acid synthase [Solirubrobacteraceae bacterium]|nr:2-succinyl-5-enolpyruvyl-6-hydroxy-3-cyclohexene-1-carboxylic-acid synthase [Solirubrobacteraceae bacterium]